MSRSAHPAGPRHADVLVGDHVALLPPTDLNALDPKVWPATARRLDGELTVGGVGVRDLVSRFGTPLFVYDEVDVRRRARDWAAAFHDGDVYYASKAFLCIGVAHWIAEEGLGLDVSTGGELTVALAAGVDPAYVVFHGNNKSEGELAQAVGSGVRTVVVDSFAEIERLARVARAAKIVQRVLVRVTVGVEAHTHEFIATAHEDQKFGFSLATGAAFEAVEDVLSRKELMLGGLHSHIGSQIFDTAGFEVAAQRLIGLLARIRDAHPTPLEELDLGGGLGVAYLSSDTPEPVREIAARLGQIVTEQCAARDVVRPRISVEPGRAIVGNAGITLYRVGTVKDVDLGGGEFRRYISVDGGMSDNIRTALYDAQYTCALAGRDSTAAAVLCRVVGRHCESGDIVVRDVFLPGDVSRGDLLAVAVTGAYCRSMASNYNFVGRPAVIGVRDGRGTLLVRRETEDDLMRLDTLWASSRGDALGVAVLGYGVVGSAVVRQLHDRSDDLAARIGRPLELRGVAVRRRGRTRALPAGFPDDLLTDDAAALVARNDIDIVVEVIGGIEPARSLQLAALTSGKSVVSANKALLADHGEALHAAASVAGVDLYYEAAVAGAIPLLRPLQESLAGDQVHRVLGIVNGTTNFILSRMDSTGAGFDEALAEATALGYAEADPTADVEGFDAAAKAAILARLAFHVPVTSADVHREGITDLTAADIAGARALGCTVKLLAICDRDSTGAIAVRVHPAMISRTHPLASVGDAYNAVFVEAQAAGSLMFYGRGAGGEPTASAVLGDVVAVARHRVTGLVRHVPEIAAPVGRPVLRPFGDVMTRYHISLDVADRPGVLAAVSTAFAEHDVSISTVRQEGRGDDATLVLVTHAAPEAALAAVVREAAGLSMVRQVAGVLRVEGGSGGQL